jgi:hypothetical protein
MFPERFLDEIKAQKKPLKIPHPPDYSQAKWPFAPTTS